MSGSKEMSRGFSKDTSSEPAQGSGSRSGSKSDPVKFATDPGSTKGSSRMQPPRMQRVVIAALAQTRTARDGCFYKDTFAEHPDDRINHKCYIQLNDTSGGIKSV